MSFREEISFEAESVLGRPENLTILVELEKLSVLLKHIFISL